MLAGFLTAPLPSFRISDERLFVSRSGTLNSEIISGNATLPDPPGNRGEQFILLGNILKLASGDPIPRSSLLTERIDKSITSTIRLSHENTITESLSPNLLR